EHYVWLDKFTIRNLELFQSHSGGVALADILDRTISPMGSRLMKRWIALPLKEAMPINERLDAVEYIMCHDEPASLIASSIKQIGDLERLISKTATGRVNPREAQQIKVALTALEPIKSQCAASGCRPLQQIADQLDLCTSLRNRIERELQPNPPLLVSKGNVMAQGVSDELDELRKMAYSGKDYLLQLQQREVKETGITSLKVGFNNVFGYYLEVTNAHKDKVPECWIRKQTLVNAERYITEELKEYEEKILGAEEKIQRLEAQLFEELVKALSDYIVPIQHNASLIARLDCLLSFAKISKERNYCRPEINNSFVIDIKEGRHPVIENQLPPGESYIPNDTLLDNDDQQIMVITGPNMSGKSAYLRQTGIMVLMAQMGCFVPAVSASIGLTDKIFCRVGASDNISLGESTFMVEMNETASILNNLSPRSLILLDEIGRGTSTYDGISIAWAIAEHLHQCKEQPKTLFATHYHELNEMAKTFERIRNYNVTIREVNNNVIFLRKLHPGGSEHSFGIHVARMAGMPINVLSRAKKLMAYLEKSHSGEKLKENSHPGKAKPSSPGKMQLSFFQLD
ncbi:MAG: DNA mismatch repair protein MutS, partial [Flavobacteriales bacterium]